MDDFIPSSRTTLKRIPKRGAYDRDTVYGILDEGFLCHVGFIVEGRPCVIPTAYGRVGDNLYLHGSAASRLLRSLGESVDVCVEVTLVDGIVLARSAFHHSMNYRSVVIFGNGGIVHESGEKLEALRAFSEHMIPGRWEDVREPSQNEMKATTVICLPLIEASAKIRTGPPLDEEQDYNLPVWAGEIPLSLKAGEPVADPALRAQIDPPSYARNYTRPTKALRLGLPSQSG